MTISQLSPRQQEIVRLVAQGRENKQIGAKLGISTSTVGNHLKVIMARVGAGTRTELVYMLFELTPKG